MSWPTQKFVSITLESDLQVEREIGVAVLREREVLLKSVEEFQARGLLTAEEAQYVLPKLSVAIQFDPLLKRSD
jgi:hypothetical protein